MRPPEFSDDDIVRAGQDLVAAGRSVTGFALRKALGGGSAGRLKQVWDEHAAKSTDSETLAADLPVGVTDEIKAAAEDYARRLTKLAAGLHSRAVKEAELRVQDLVRAAAEQRKQSERELADASNTVEDLEGQLSATKAECKSQQKSLEELRKHCHELEFTLRSTAEQLSAERQQLERQAKELEEAASKVLGMANLQGQADALKEQNAALMSKLKGS